MRAMFPAGRLVRCLGSFILVSLLLATSSPFAAEITRVETSSSASLEGVTVVIISEHSAPRVVLGH